MVDIEIYNPDNAIQSVTAIQQIVKGLRDELFNEGVDFGKIPGTGNKPTLLLPGMEKLLRALRLRPEYHAITIIEDFDKPLFMYRYECRLYEADSDICISTAIGSANSQEDKWGIRWVEAHDLNGATPLREKRSTISEFKFAIDKAETSGQYGKPQSYWAMWTQAIQSGQAQKIQKPTRNGAKYDAYQIDSVMYAIPNERVFDQVNTIDKIAQKRALGSAIKLASNVSEWFTVDLEDLAIPPRPSITVSKTDDDENVIDGELVENSVSDLRNPQQSQTLQQPVKTPENGTQGNSEDVMWFFDADVLANFAKWLESKDLTRFYVEIIAGQQISQYATKGEAFGAIDAIVSNNTNAISSARNKYFNQTMPAEIKKKFNHFNHFNSWLDKHWNELNLNASTDLLTFEANIYQYFESQLKEAS